MFETLTEKLQKAFERLGGRGVLTEEAVTSALHEVQIALLEADVNYRVVKDFVAKVGRRATGVEVMKGLKPAEQVVKIVDEELTELLGGSDDNTKLKFAVSPPTVYMLVGLQVQARRRMLVSSRISCAGKAEIRCWWPAIFIARPRSSSSKLSAKR